MDKLYFTILFIFLVMGLVSAEAIRENQLEEGILVNMEFGEGVDINFLDKDYSVKLDKLNVFTAYLSVGDKKSSFEIGDVNDFDLNEDGELDISIKLDSITITSKKESIELFIKSFETEKEIWSVELGGLIVVGILFLVFFIMKLLKSKKFLVIKD